MHLGPGVGLMSGGRGGAAAPFDPSQIAGLALWLEADSGVTGTTTVTRWADKSAAGNDATPPLSGPSLVTAGGPNGLHAVQFDGTGNSVLSNAGGNLGNTSVGQTVFAVLKAAATTGQQIALSTDSTESSGGYALEINVQGNGERGILVVGQAYVQDSAASATTNWEAWTVLGNGAAQTLRVNGTQRTTGAITPGATTNAGYILGGYTTAQLPFAAGGRLWGLMVYNRTLSAGEVAQVESYIRSKTVIW